MTDLEIVRMILNEKTFESKMKLAELVGYDRLKNMVERVQASGRHTPATMDSILGLLLENEEKKLTKLLDESTPAQAEVLAKASKIILGDAEIVNKILEQKTFESQMEMAELVGFKRLHLIVSVMKMAGKNIPDVMNKIIATLSNNEYKKIAALLEGASPEQLEVLAKAFGTEKCSGAFRFLSTNDKVYSVIHSTTPIRHKESEDFVTLLEETGKNDCELAQKMVMIHGIEKTEKDIEATKTSRPVKPVVDEVMKPLRTNKSRKNI